VAAVGRGEKFAAGNAAADIHAAVGNGKDKVRAAELSAPDNDGDTVLRSGGRGEPGKDHAGCFGWGHGRIPALQAPIKGTSDHLKSEMPFFAFGIPFKPKGESPGRLYE
jgi:hypothetical protein